MIKDHIATSVTISVDDFDDTPFHSKGGRVKAFQVFGDDLVEVLNELNTRLAA